MSSAGRLIASCLAVLAAGLVVLGCGSGSDSTGANIDPQTATDLTGQLDRIQAFFDAGNCDRASGAVDNLRVAVDAVSGQTGEQFTADAQELVDNLDKQVADQCRAPDKTTSSTTQSSTTIPTTTDTIPTTTDTTTTTTTDTTKSTTTTTTSTSTTPTGPPGNPNGPGGGVNPGGGKKAAAKGPSTKKPKHEGMSKHDEKERNR